MDWNNPEDVRAYKRAYLQRTMARMSTEERREFYRVTKATWRANNPEGAKEGRRRYETKHREAVLAKKREAQRRYRKRCPVAHAATAQIHRARKKNAVGSHSCAEVMELFAKQGGKCAGCRCKISGKYKAKNRFQEDHVISLSKGGDNYITNIELLCLQCNASKNDMDDLEWAAEHGRLFV